MADNKTYTLESAKELFAGDNWDEAVDKMSLEEMMSLDKAIYGQPIAEGVSDEAKFVRDEARKRIEDLLAKDTLAPDELDSVAAFVEQFASNSINGESVYANDSAKALMEKIEKQKEEIAKAAQENQNAAEENAAAPIEVEENTGNENTQENQTENTAEAKTDDEFVFGDESNTQDAPQEEKTEEKDENTQDAPQDENTEEKEDEEKVTFPERREITEEEYPAMLDPLSQDMPEMTDEEKQRQAERLEKVMALEENIEYQPEYITKEGSEEEKDSVYDTLKFTIERSAERKLTVSHDDINEENLKKARAEEEERIAIEYYNSIFGVCKTEEELDKETPQEHVERLGKVAELISQKKPRAEIYAAMGIKPTKEQEQIAANAVYRTNAEPAMEWAKNLGKSGLKFIDKYREFEKNNPQVSLGLGLAMSGNPLYMGARMALSARGLYKDYENYKKEHPNEKHTFLGMLKDKDARKSLMANASIFIRSVPVVGQAYGVGMMAKKLKETCKKSFWKDLGNKFKDAGKSLKELAKNPKDKSKWKDAWDKVGKPATVVGGLALTAFAAYKMIDTPATPIIDKDHDGIPDTIDRDGGEGWANKPMIDKDHDGVPDTIDRDGGEGWANNVTQTQIDRAFDADPAGINEEMQKLDPNWKWHSSEELHKMMDENKFNHEQLKAVYIHAGSHFDENGHIIDSDLKEYYNNLNRAPAPASAPAQEATPKIEVDESKLEVSAPNVTAQTPPENPEMATPEEVRDEAYYQEQKDALNPKGQESLKDGMQDALKDENKTVEEAIDSHMDAQVARGTVSAQQGEELGNVVKDQVGILDGKGDDDISKKDINNAVKETQKIEEAMKANADENIVANNLVFDEDLNYARDHLPENPAESYSQDTKTSEYYKGLEEKTEEMYKAVRHGENPGHVLRDALRNGELSEEQATSANLRYAELTGEGKSPEQALKTMVSDYKREGSFWNAQEKAAALENTQNLEATNTAPTNSSQSNNAPTNAPATQEGATQTNSGPTNASPTQDSQTPTNNGQANQSSGNAGANQGQTSSTEVKNELANVRQRIAAVRGIQNPSFSPDVKGAEDHIPSKEEAMNNRLKLPLGNNGNGGR